MMKRYFWIVLTSLLFSLMTNCHAQKIGYLDYELFIAEMPATKYAQEELTKIQNDYQKNGEVIVAAYQEKVIEYKKLLLGHIPPVKEKEIIEELQKEEAKIAAYQEEMRTTLAKRSKEFFDPIHLKVRTAIKEIAKENGYSYIFNTQESIKESRWLSIREEQDDISLLLKAKLGLSE